MFVSVVIATRNRAEWIRGALASLEAQDAPTDAFEVVVVDNGSSDGTPAVIASFAERLPHFRSVRLPEAGLSAARNLGMQESKGQVIAIMDDDARASSNWVGAMAASFAKDDRGVVGGPIELVWPARPPRWMSSDIASLYAALDLGSVERELSHPLMPYGANMGIRRTVVDEVGGFSTRIGRVGGGLISADDGELCWRVEDAGWRIVYDPDVHVLHHVQPERVRVRWMLRRAFEQGRTRALASALRGLRRSRLDWLALVGLSLAQTVSMSLRGMVALVTLRGRARVMTAVMHAVQTFACALQALRIAATPSAYAPEP